VHEISRLGGNKKGRQWKTACRKRAKFESNLGLGLAETSDAIARFPLTALFEQVDAFEALQNVALNNEARGTLKTFVLGHGV
jgi:hypothetical protein